MGFLRSLKGVEDLLLPGTAAWWRGLSKTQKHKVGWFIKRSWGKDAWKRFQDHLKERRKEEASMLRIKQALHDEDFVLAEKEKIADSATKLIVLPMKTKISRILALAVAHKSDKEIAEHLGISPAEVRAVVTKENIEFYKQHRGDCYDALWQFLEDKAVARLALAEAEDLKLSEAISLLKFVRDLRKRDHKEKVPAEAIDVTAESEAEARHQFYEAEEE